MEVIDKWPLVSVPVVTYNSSKYVIETLESIKAQTYQNIELIVSDDCSTDDTVELCRGWIEKNKHRFVRTELITIEKNTGISANINRAESACRGKWVKIIAGDDLLVPKCIEICVGYVKEHPATMYLFGKQNVFGADVGKCRQINETFDYSFFKLDREEQLHRLVFVGNCIPAATGFYNKEKCERIGIRNDERIPLLEDWPRWINLLKAGVKFDFVEKIIVNYRISGISTSSVVSPKFHRSQRLFFYLYIYPELVKENFEGAVNKLVNEEVEAYEYTCRIEEKIFKIQHSFPYRLWKVMMKPIFFFKKCVR